MRDENSVDQITQEGEQKASQSEHVIQKNRI